MQGDNYPPRFDPETFSVEDQPFLEYHPHFDASGIFRIHDSHLMAFLHSDGFTERLLSVKIFITKSLEVKAFISSFRKGKRYGDFYSEPIIPEVPFEILTFLDELFEADHVDFGFNKIQECYSTDCSTQEFIFNYHGETLVFHRNGCMRIGLSDFETDLGKRFFALSQFLDAWKEQLYCDFERRDA